MSNIKPIVSRQQAAGYLRDLAVITLPPNDPDYNKLLKVAEEVEKNSFKAHKAFKGLVLPKGKSREAQALHAALSQYDPPAIETPEEAAAMLRDYVKLATSPGTQQESQLLGVAKSLADIKEDEASKADARAFTMLKTLILPPPATDQAVELHDALTDYRTSCQRKSQVESTDMGGRYNTVHAGHFSL